MTENHEFNFIVVFKDDHTKPALIEGSKANVLAWLSERADPDHYDVYHGSSKLYVSGADFLERAKSVKMTIAGKYELKRVLEFVPKYYMMNAETDELLPNASYLANGMKVLIENPDVRASEKDMQRDWGMQRALENNRWCTVTHLEFMDQKNMIRFIGVYEDGSKIVRVFGSDRSWLVKIDSVSESMAERTERYSNVRTLVLAALHRQDMATQGGDNGNTMDVIADEFTKQILGIL